MAASEGSWSKNQKSRLISQPWQAFYINNKHYLVKSQFSEFADSYEVCISDFQKIWHETLDQETIKTRAKELNPDIEADMSYIMKHVQKNVEEQQTPSTYQTIHKEDGSDDKLVLHLKTKLQAGVPFVWDFHCSLTDEPMITSHLLEPLVDMIAELQRRQTEMQNLLKKKDLEINEYKESGVKLSNKRLQTKQFDPEAFKNKMLLSSGFGSTIARSKTLAFSEGMQDLYKQVTAKRAQLEEKGFRETEIPGENNVLETERGLGVPASLFSDPSPNVSPQVSPKKTPVTSPEKTSTGNSPTKVRELQRREELRRKLADEAERKKRKPKKIKL